MASSSNPVVKFLQGFVHAGRGIITSLGEQLNLKVHLLATLVVAGAGLYFSITRMEWLAIILTIGLVWVAELFNSALEYLTDLVTKDHHPLARKAKDAAAGAVLAAAIMAVVVALFVFGKYLF